MNLTEIAAILANASGVVGVDTGLAHLAAALSNRTVDEFIEWAIDEKVSAIENARKLHRKHITDRQQILNNEQLQPDGANRTSSAKPEPPEASIYWCSQE